ncbi:MAG: DUF1553 domain-containing protein [Acidobacteriia bacterium]|nr:DUF1553 domain-containing protein [Terriglobia bacterium]
MRRFSSIFSPSPDCFLLIIKILILVSIPTHLSWAHHSFAAKPLIPSVNQVFTDNILPIFKEHCLQCHGNELSIKELNLASIETLFSGSESGQVVVPGRPNKSKLFQLIETGNMPPDQKGTIPKEQLETIRIWISKKLSYQSAKKKLNQHDVIPIMLRHCVTCHGVRRQENYLDLRTRDSMLRGGESGPAFVPGKPKDSLMIQKIHSGLMPPNKRLFEVGVTPVSKTDLRTLEEWILQGAPETQLKPDIATNSPDPLVSDEDRQFWAFQPPKQARLPNVESQEQVINPIDSFILEKLEAQGLSLSEEASRLTLIRRVTFDLTGLPPTSKAVRKFVQDSDPQAYQKLVDSLLESPHYGERWGRYWLDLAGYADYEGGKVNKDGPGRKNAWRYRDYVIQSLNADKPYDQFLLEQIAGDELIDYESAPVIREDMINNLVATGFLRMGPDSTGYELSFVEDRFDVIADEIEILGTGILGMTLQCARCHSHKFDPIPQRDYYRLADTLKGALDEFDWLAGTPINEVVRFQQRVLPYVIPGINPIRLMEINKQREDQNEKLEEKIKVFEKALDKLNKPLKEKVLDKRFSQLSMDLYNELKHLVSIPENKRNERQKLLAKKYKTLLMVSPKELKEVDPVYRKRAEEIERKIIWLRYEQKTEPNIRALWDRGSPSPTYMLKRGEYSTPGRLVGPGVPSVLTDGKTTFDVNPPWPGSNKTGRRLALARWLVKKNNPLTARVMVNRIWRHHFGKGIVETLGNFGRSGARPTHPELLDWLAVEFIEQKWSLKSMHRLIMDSATYRQSSKVTQKHEELDLENNLLSRWPIKRMDGETLRDSLLLVSGRLDKTRFGPPDPIFVRSDGLATGYSREKGWRRSIYLSQPRLTSATTLDLFDYPQMNPNCVERSQSTVAPQALHLLNDSNIRSLANFLARQVTYESDDELEKQIVKIYWIVLNRPPDPKEKRITIEAVKATLEGLNYGSEPLTMVLAKLVHTLFNSAAFVYID